MDWQSMPIEARAESLASLVRIRAEISFLIGPFMTEAKGPPKEGEEQPKDLNERERKTRLDALLKLADLDRDIAMCRAAASEGGAEVEVVALRRDLAAYRRRCTQLEILCARYGIRFEEEEAEG